ncbi:MAG: exopolysaccharide Pel transporter PelG [Anaerolineales bacterium]
MAGIGFELKKLFAKKGLLLQARANLYASLVVAGPMLMGALFLLGARYISTFGGASIHQQDLIVVIITYSLLFSLILTSSLLFVLSRFVADMLYIDAHERVLPSMYGAISFFLVIGSVMWVAFLIISKLDFTYGLYSFILFCEGVVAWIQISYISAVKEYRGILLGFLIGIVSGLLVSLIFIFLKYEVVASLLAGTCVAYGVLIVDFTIVLHEFFPMGSGSPFKFLEWIDKYPQLPFVGFFSTLGLFIHLLLMWTSPWGIQVDGLFYHAPRHDIPALLAFMTSLVTTVNFVTSVEVNFYPKYRLYFSLLNGDGSLSNIEKAYDDMLDVLKQEIFFLAIQQIFITLFSITLVGEMLSYLKLGFTASMIEMFRVLCVGYGIYAIGNVLMLFLLYFSSNTDALWAVSSFFVVNTLVTLYTISLSQAYYGFGFVLAGVVLYIVALRLLFSYTDRLDYYIFTKQPVFFVQKKSFLTRLADRLDS